MILDRKQLLIIQTGEEAAELVQEISKCLRFGPHEQYAGSDKTNIQRVVFEFNDLLALMEMLIQGPFIDRDLILQKKLKVEKNLRYSEKCGILK